MSDPIAQAAEHLNDAAPSSTEPAAPVEAGTAAAGEPLTNAASQSSQPEPVIDAAPVETPSIVGAQSDPVIAEQPAAEHLHTSILRRMTETLRRKWNLFDSELEAVLKDAESHL